MNRKKKVQIVSVALLAFGLILGIFSFDFCSTTSKFGLGALLLGTAGSILSVFIPTKYRLDFSKNRWVVCGGGKLCIEIPRKIHGMGQDPQYKVSIKADMDFEEIIVDGKVDDKGNVKITILGEEFDGRVIII